MRHSVLPHPSQPSPIFMGEGVAENGNLATARISSKQNKALHE